MPVVAIVGATGKTGRWALKGAIERELEVRVLARSPDKLAPLLADLGGQSEDLEKITVVEGSVTDADKLETLMDGADVVMSFLGMTNPPEWVVSPGVEAVMGALLSLRKAGKTPPRFLSMSSIVLGDSAEQGRRAWGCFVAWLVPKARRCGRRQSGACRRSHRPRPTAGCAQGLLRRHAGGRGLHPREPQGDGSERDDSASDGAQDEQLCQGLHRPGQDVQAGAGERHGRQAVLLCGDAGEGGGVGHTDPTSSLLTPTRRVAQSVCEAFLDVATTGEYEDAEVSVFAA